MQFQPHDEYSKKIARLEKVCINDITSDSYTGIFSCYLAIVQTMYPFIIIFLHNMELLITITKYSSSDDYFTMYDITMNLSQTWYQ